MYETIAAYRPGVAVQVSQKVLLTLVVEGRIRAGATREHTDQLVAAALRRAAILAEP